MFLVAGAPATQRLRDFAGNAAQRDAPARRKPRAAAVIQTAKAARQATNAATLARCNALVDKPDGQYSRRRLPLRRRTGCANNLRLTRRAAARKVHASSVDGDGRGGARALGWLAGRRCLRTGLRCAARPRRKAASCPASRRRWRRSSKIRRIGSRAIPEVKRCPPGVPRAAYMPQPFRIFQGENTLFITYRYAGAVRGICTENPRPAP